MHGADVVRLVPARLGDEGEDIAYVQRKLGAFPASGILDENTASRIRGIQRIFGFDVTGELDPKTLAAIRTMK